MIQGNENAKDARKQIFPCTSFYCLTFFLSSVTCLSGQIGICVAGRSDDWLRSLIANGRYLVCVNRSVSAQEASPLAVISGHCALQRAATKASPPQTADKRGSFINRPGLQSQFIGKTSPQPQQQQQKITFAFNAS